MRRPLFLPTAEAGGIQAGFSVKRRTAIRLSNVSFSGGRQRVLRLAGLACFPMPWKSSVIWKGRIKRSPVHIAS